MPKHLENTDTKKVTNQKSVVSTPKAKKLRTSPQYPPCPSELARMIQAANGYLEWQTASEDEKGSVANTAAKVIARYYYREYAADLVAGARAMQMANGDEFRRHLLWKAQLLSNVLSHVVYIRHRFKIERDARLTPGELARVGQWDLVLHLPTYDPQTSARLYEEIMSICEKEGVTTDRFKRCSICSRFFWAKKPSTPYCRRPECYHTHDKRKQREKKRGEK